MAGKKKKSSLEMDHWNIRLTEEDREMIHELEETYPDIKSRVDLLRSVFQHVLDNKPSLTQVYEPKHAYAA